MKSKKGKKIKVGLIQAYMPAQEFEEHKEMVQSLIVRILLEDQERKYAEEGVRPSPPSNQSSG